MPQSLHSSKDPIPSSGSVRKRESSRNGDAAGGTFLASLKQSAESLYGPNMHLPSLPMEMKACSRGNEMHRAVSLEALSNPLQSPFGHPEMQNVELSASTPALPKSPPSVRSTFLLKRSDTMLKVEACLQRPFSDTVQDRRLKERIVIGTTDTVPWSLSSEQNRNMYCGGL